MKDAMKDAMKSPGLSRRFVVGALAGAACSLAVPAITSHVQAAETPDAVAEIMVLHATKKPGNGSIDPGIGNMPQLKKPPFDTYNTYKLLDKKKVGLKKGNPSNYPLVNGHQLELILLERTWEPPIRFRLGGSIRPPKGEAFLKKIEVSASANEPFFVAGQNYNGGILVVGITMH